MEELFMEKIKVGIWGFGAMGSGIAKLLLEKEGVEIIGICDLHPERIGKDFHEALGLDTKSGVLINPKIEEVIKDGNADVCIIATDSFTKTSFEKIKYVVEEKVNVISTAEEMSYPKANEPELADIMDQLARENGVSILGTGINPGHIMDMLVLVLTGAMGRVDHIEAKRVNSLSPFGHAVMEEQGVGMKLDDFNDKMSRDELAGHVGFRESTMMITDGLGLDIEEFTQTMAPIVTNVDRTSPYGFAAAGDVCGVDMQANVKVDGKDYIKMIHPQQIEPELEGVYTGDYITVKGDPEINMAITPEVSGGIGTIAMCVNMIPHVINARPGLKTMIDLPIPRAIMGDMRKFLDK
jgi:4-hydroxy-tetrahydrodipicolinate reductase